jgi:hypothetical protein
MGTVIYDDDLGLKDVWKECIQYCRMVFGTEEYIEAVDNLRINIPNLKDGPKLKDEITDYAKDLEDWKENELNNWITDHPADAREIAIYKDEEKYINIEAHKKLYSFILQLLEDNEQCLHKSGMI